MALFYDLPVYPVKLLCQAEGLFNGVNRDTYKLILKIFEFTKDFSKEYKYTAKAGLIDHFSPGRLQFSYIAKQQILNSSSRWSILSGQLWSNPLVFPHHTQVRNKRYYGVYTIVGRNIQKLR